VTTIRPARAADDAALVGIDDAAWNDTSSPAPTPPPGRAFFDEDRTPDGVLVAERDGAVVGYVVLGRGFPLASHAHVLVLKEIAVDVDAVGTGIGEALVRAAVAEARRRGARRLTLRVLTTNPVAQRLYTRCGFAVEGVLRGEFHLGGRYVDDALMAIDLTAT